MNELTPVAWMTMDTPPKEEDGTILVWAENMPVSIGCCEDGYYVFTECEDLHNYFEGNGEWLKEHWTLWMWVPDPGNKAIPDTHRVVSVDRLRGIQSAFFEAEEDVRDWGAYASEYMQTKHGLDEQALVYKRMAESLSAIIDNKGAT